MIDVFPAHRVVYAGALRHARRTVHRIAAATSPSHEMPRNATYFLTADLQSGFGVTHDGDLIGLFSLVKGRGDDLIGWASKLGAKTLDCFDGFLPTLYARHGFREVRRESNWTAGEPDVVFMARV